MSYITNQNMQDRVGLATLLQLTDDDGDGQADTAVLDEVRNAAEGEVNSYFARRYETPIDLAIHTGLVGLLTSVTLDLAEHRLRLRRPPVAKDVSERLRHALTWLSRVADGTLELPSSGVALSSHRGKNAATIGDTRTLSRDELSDF